MSGDFEEIAEFLKMKMNSFSDEQKLFMYGLYKQGTVGDAPKAHNKFSLVDSYKHDAWQKNRGMLKETAQRKYVAIGKKLIQLIDANPSR